MKAIQVRYIPCTNTKPARLKVWAHETKPAYVTDTDKPHKTAMDYANSYGWLEYNSWTESEYKLTEGQLPNGDYCYVITEVKHV